MNHVGMNMPSKWQLFGIGLEIPMSELDTYPTHSCVACLTRMFDSWERKGSPVFSWENVINVFESPMLKERRLANEVRKMISDRRETLPSKNLAPAATSSRRVYQSGSTSSLGSHVSNTTYHASDGSVTTQTLC